MVNCVLALWVIILTECLCHKSADKKMPAFPVIGKADTVISFIIGERCQNLFFLVFQGFDSAKGTDIIFFITVYRFPDFLFYWKHLLFYSLRNRKEELNKFDKKIWNFITTLLLFQTENQKNKAPFVFRTYGMITNGACCFILHLPESLPE